MSSQNANERSGSNMSDEASNDRPPRGMRLKLPENQFSKETLAQCENKRLYLEMFFGPLRNDQWEVPDENVRTSVQAPALQAAYIDGCFDVWPVPGSRSSKASNK